MVVFWLLHLFFLFAFAAIGEAQLKPLLINCGSNSIIDVGGRRWVGDLVSGTNLTLSSPGIITSAATLNGPSTYGSLYRTARVFNTTSNYTFSVVAGNYYMRLHFYPFSLDNFNANESTFDVMANNLKLVSEYSIPGDIARKNSYLLSLGSNSTVGFLLKEYFINISSDKLWIEFIPTSGSFAFVNAIEIIPVLDNFFFGSASKVGSNSSNLIDRGMETMYRLNVGGPEIYSDRDLWRRWELDAKYMFSVNAASVLTNRSYITYASANDSSIAPLLVYEAARMMTDTEVVDKKFNMSWKFDVDPNFDYLVRLHFCELFYDKENQRIFRIYINFRTAAENYDVFVRAGGKNKAYHEDFIDAVSEQTDTLWVQLGPDTSTSASGTDALLNGLEIFKLSRNGNLAHASEKIETGSGGPLGKQSKRKNLWIEISTGVISVLIFSIVLVMFYLFCIRKKKKASVKSSPSGWHPLVLHGTMGSTTDARAAKITFHGNGLSPTNRTGRRFTIAEIRAATKIFDVSLVIGTGGFGKVYRGEIEDGNPVAIKRANQQSEQGLSEFETEIEMLSKLRHRHLVSLIGYCDEENEMILVYEYMANGTLRSHLFGSDNPPLSWKQRLHICIGAARGLHYLHTGAERGIIHRDVKTTNILLDENFVAKMADFGLSKTGPTLDHTHVSTAVKGSFGYLDPEYFRRQQLTQKSDVYSFGVVLFEVVCARPVINPTLPKDQINLAEWAVRWQRQGSLETIVDPHLEGKYSTESLKKFGEIAEKCLADEGKIRPTMGEVLWYLEYILQLHEAYTRSEDGNSVAVSSLRFADMPLSLPLIKEVEESVGDGSASIRVTSVDSKSEGCTKDVTGCVEFSQVFQPQGR